MNGCWKTAALSLQHSPAMRLNELVAVRGLLRAMKRLGMPRRCEKQLDGGWIVSAQKGRKG